MTSHGLNYTRSMILIVPQNQLVVIILTALLRNWIASFFWFLLEGSTRQSKKVKVVECLFEKEKRNAKR